MVWQKNTWGIPRSGKLLPSSHRSPWRKGVLLWKQVSNIFCFVLTLPTAFAPSFCELDALIYGHFRAILTTPIPAQNGTLGFLVGKFKNLVGHIKKIDRYIMKCNTDFTGHSYKLKVSVKIGIQRSSEASLPFLFYNPTNPSYPVASFEIKIAPWSRWCRAYFRRRWIMGKSIWRRCWRIVFFRNEWMNELI